MVFQIGVANVFECGVWFRLVFETQIAAFETQI